MKLINKYFPGLSEAQVRQFNMLPGLYENWNRRVNLISRKDLPNLEVHHVLHSLSIARLISFKPRTQILDAGTGGGFPGIPLAIMFPEVSFLLADSIGKKINAVKEIAGELGLKNVRAEKTRVEDIDEDMDFVVSRAVAHLAEIHNWTRDLIQPGGENDLRNGWLILKGGDLSGEKAGLKKEVVEFELSSWFSEDIFLTKKVVYFSR